MLANFLGARKASQFSLIEIGIAFECRKPIIIVVDKTGNPHNHSLIEERIATYTTDNLDEAIDLTKHLLAPIPTTTLTIMG